MIATLLDFTAVATLITAAVSFPVYLGFRALEDEILPEYLGFVTLCTAFLWAAQHVVRM